MPVLATMVPWLLMPPLTEDGPPLDVKAVPAEKQEVSGVAEENAGAIGRGNRAGRGIGDAGGNDAAIQIDAGVAGACAGDRSAIDDPAFDGGGAAGAENTAPWGGGEIDQLDAIPARGDRAAVADGAVDRGAADVYTRITGGDRPCIPDIALDRRGQGGTDGRSTWIPKPPAIFPEAEFTIEPVMVLPPG